MNICDVNYMKKLIKTFSRFGDAGHGGITRYALSHEDKLARDFFVKEMTSLGTKIYCDDLSNMYAIMEGTDPSLPSIVMASHCDSVKNGGNYDGILGVMGAMSVLHAIKENNIKHTHNIVAMIWTNEEGSLYPPAMMCSGMVCNEYMPEAFKNKFSPSLLMKSHSIIDNEITFEDALHKFKYKGERINRLNPQDYYAMFELHIEQGPILEAHKKDIGVVTCVLGMVNYRIKIYGESDHAGTTPMKYRHDALYAAANVLIYLHQELDKLAPDLVYTTGEIILHPNVHTVIPDYVEFSLDIRHKDPQIIKKAVKVIESIPHEISNCHTGYECAWNRDTVHFNKHLISLVRRACVDLAYSHEDINSGAGHDAQFASYMLPTTMIFVPSKDGHSHCEKEFTSLELCNKGASVMLNAVLSLDKEKVS